MGTFSIWHWLIVLAVVLVLFGGKGKISSLMGDFGKGLKSFKKNIKDDNDDSADDDGAQRQAIGTDPNSAGKGDAAEKEKATRS